MSAKGFYVVQWIEAKEEGGRGRWKRISPIYGSQAAAVSFKETAAKGGIDGCEVTNNFEPRGSKAKLTRPGKRQTSQPDGYQP